MNSPEIRHKDLPPTATPPARPPKPNELLRSASASSRDQFSLSAMMPLQNTQSKTSDDIAKMHRDCVRSVIAKTETLSGSTLEEILTNRERCHELVTVLAEAATANMFEAAGVPFAAESCAQEARAALLKLENLRKRQYTVDKVLLNTWEKDLETQRLETSMYASLQPIGWSSVQKRFADGIKDAERASHEFLQEKLDSTEEQTQTTLNDFVKEFKAFRRELHLLREYKRFWDSESVDCL